MSAQHMMLQMMVAMQSKEELAQKAIDSITEWKNLGCPVEGTPSMEAAKDAICVFLKIENGDKSFTQIMDDMMKKDKIAQTAMDIHKMVNDNNIDL